MAGILAGFLSDRKTGGVDSGNSFINNQYQQQDNDQAQAAIRAATGYQGSKDALDPLQSSRTATSEVGNNSILGQILGKGGTLDRTTAQEQDLAGRGFSLQPEDYEAYGQGSDNIARQFGAAGGSLGQALSDRGLSDSAGAGQSFSGLQGSKLEQLGQMQQQIAKQRMDTNMARLGQTRNFLGQLTGEAGNAIQQQAGRQMGSEAANFGETMGKADQGTNFLKNEQDQKNEQLMQRQQTQATPGWAQGLSNMSNMGSQIATSWATMGTGKTKDQKTKTDADNSGDE